jgi:hypothetical protein
MPSLPFDIPERYSDLSGTPLRVEVHAGKVNEFELELSE